MDRHNLQRCIDWWFLDEIIFPSKLTIFEKILRIFEMILILISNDFDFDFLGNQNHDFDFDFQNDFDFDWFPCPKIRWFWFWFPKMILILIDFHSSKLRWFWFWFPKFKWFWMPPHLLRALRRWISPSRCHRGNRMFQRAFVQLAGNYSSSGNSYCGRVRVYTSVGV